MVQVGYPFLPSEWLTKTLIMTINLTSHEVCQLSVGLVEDIYFSSLKRHTFLLFGISLHWVWVLTEWLISYFFSIVLFTLNVCHVMWVCITRWECNFREARILWMLKWKSMVKVSCCIYLRYASIQNFWALSNNFVLAHLFCLILVARM